MDEHLTAEPDQPEQPIDLDPVELDPAVAGVVEALAGVAGVVGVALGGSRARGRSRPDSDWDLGVFVAPPFQPAAVAALADHNGWVGTVAERGEWGPVVDGGAWLTVEGRRIDLLWRDVAGLARLAAEAERGEFTVVRIPFHLAGIPSYTPLGELSVNRTLRGQVPPALAMPEALRRRGATWWADNARFDLDYAAALARRAGSTGSTGSTGTADGDLAVASGLVVRGLVELAHARQCRAGRWVLNEKGLLAEAGLDHLAAPVAVAVPAGAAARLDPSPGPDPEVVLAWIAAVAQALDDLVAAAAAG